MSSVAHSLSEIRRSSSGEQRSGVWEGRVESIDDPDRMNRVKVRIFNIHGDNQRTSLAGLPWAEVADQGGGGPDYGSGGGLYPVGSTVWIMFRQGNDDYPVVIGGRRGSSPTRDENNPYEFLTVDGTDESTVETPWLPTEGENEIPADIFEKSADGDRHPTRTVWHKSFRGHTILVEDREEAEFLRIIDRAGQVIEMNCPVKSDNNDNNAAQRGARSSIEDDQLSQEQLVDGRAYIRLKDVAGQEVLLDGASNNEEIRITSRNRQGSSIQQILLSTKKGEEKIEILDKQGTLIRLDPNGPTSLEIADYSGNQIKFKPEDGTFEVVASNKQTDQIGGSRIETVGGKRDSTVGGDDILKVLGNKFVDIMTDLAISVNGLTSAVLTGPLNITVVNAQVSGSVADMAAKLESAIGGIDINSQICGTGKMHLGTLSGDVDIDTIFGDILAETKLGSIDLKSTTGQVFTDTTSTKIGSSTADEPLVLGDALTTALNDFVNDVFVANASKWGIGNQGSPVPLNPDVVSAITDWLADHVTSTLIISDTRFTQKL